MNWFVMTEKLDGFTSRSEDEFCGGKKKSWTRLKNWAQHCVSTKRLVMLATSSHLFLVKYNFRYLPN